MNEFMIKDENNIERKATVITVIENEGKEYVVYSIARDEHNVNIFVSRLAKDSAGNEVIVDITDANEKARLNELVREIIKLPLVGGE